MVNRVYIGCLSSSATERDVKHFFRGYGKLRDIVLKNGFGFIEFDSSREADDAIYDLNGKELAGDRVNLQLARRGPRADVYGGGGGRGGGGGGGGRDSFGARGGNRYGPPTKTRHRMIVENLSTHISWQDLKDMCRKYGEVTFADAHRDKKNEGMICFASRDDLKHCMDKLDGKDVNGRKIKLIDDSDDRGGSRSRSRSRGRGRSGSRSKSRSRSPRSKSPRGRDSRSRSKSRSPRRDRDDKSRSRSRSRSAKRSRSGTPKKRDDKSRSNCLDSFTCGLCADVVKQGDVLAHSETHLSAEFDIFCSGCEFKTKKLQLMREHIEKEHVDTPELLEGDEDEMLEHSRQREIEVIAELVRKSDKENSRSPTPEKMDD